MTTTLISYFELKCYFYHPKVGVGIIILIVRQEDKIRRILGKKVVDQKLNTRIVKKKPTFLPTLQISCKHFHIISKSTQKMHGYF